MKLVQAYNTLLKYERISAQLDTLKEAMATANRRPPAVKRAAERKERFDPDVVQVLVPYWSMKTVADMQRESSSLLIGAEKGGLRSALLQHKIAPLGQHSRNGSHQPRQLNDVDAGSGNLD
ncbi:hypothetical protein PI126_g22263 [Phytophthora idaei]|nr:hypothetical protein PI126_g22263 [Phytophthora idaei]